MAGEGGDAEAATRMKLLRDISCVSDGLLDVVIGGYATRVVWSDRTPSLDAAAGEGTARVALRLAEGPSGLAIRFRGPEGADAALPALPLAAVRDVKCTAQFGPSLEVSAVLRVAVRLCPALPSPPAPACCIVFDRPDAAKAWHSVLHHAPAASGPAPPAGAAVAAATLRALRASLASATAAAAQPVGAPSTTAVDQGVEMGTASLAAAPEADSGVPHALLTGDRMLKAPFMGRSKPRPRWVWLAEGQGDTPRRICWCAPAGVSPRGAGSSEAATAVNRGWSALARPEQADAAGAALRKALPATHASSLPLGDVVEVRAGHATPVLRKVASAHTGASRLHADRCFSLVTDARTLDLAAPSAAVRDQWVQALRQVVAEQEAEGGDRGQEQQERPSDAGLEPAPAPAPQQEPAPNGHPEQAAPPEQPDQSKQLNQAVPSTPGPELGEPLVPALLCNPRAKGCGAVVPLGKFCGVCGRHFAQESAVSSTDGREGAPVSPAAVGKRRGEPLRVPPWLLAPGKATPRLLLSKPQRTPQGAGPTPQRDKARARRAGPAVKRTPRVSAAPRVRDSGQPPAQRPVPSAAASAGAAAGHSPGRGSDSDSDSGSGASSGEGGSGSTSGDAAPGRAEAFKSAGDYAHLDPKAELERAKRVLPKRMLHARSVAQSAPLHVDTDVSASWSRFRVKEGDGGNSDGAASAQEEEEPASDGEEEEEGDAEAGANEEGTQGGPVSTRWEGLRFWKRAVNNGVSLCAACGSGKRVCNCTKCQECAQLLQGLGARRHHCRDCGAPLCHSCWAWISDDGRNRVCKRRQRCAARQERYGVPHRDSRSDDATPQAGERGGTPQAPEPGGDEDEPGYGDGVGGDAEEETVPHSGAGGGTPWAEDDAVSTVSTQILAQDRRLGQQIATVLGEGAEEAKATARDLARARKHDRAKATMGRERDSPRYGTRSNRDGRGRITRSGSSRSRRVPVGATSSHPDLGPRHSPAAWHGGGAAALRTVSSAGRARGVGADSHRWAPALDGPAFGGVVAEEGGDEDDSYRPDERLVEPEVREAARARGADILSGLAEALGGGQD